MRAAKNRTPNHTLPEQVLHYRCTDAALLETISSIWIYQNRRDVPEGDLTRLRATIVSGSYRTTAHGSSRKKAEQ